MKSLKLLSILSTIDDEVQASVSKKWDSIKGVYVETAEKVLEFRKKKRKVWITLGTWTKIDERRKLKRSY